MPQTQTTSKPIDDEEEGGVEDFKSVGSNKNPIKILPIGVGQGGAKLAHAIGMQNDCASKCVYINTSKRDIEGLELNDTNRFIAVGDGKIDGSGKDRHVSFGFFKEKLNDYIAELKKFLKEEAYDIIFVCFSTAGGTGSGIGPKLTGALTSKGVLDEISASTGKTPIVFGMAELPELSTSEGNISYENTLEALQDIDKLVNPKDKDGNPLPDNPGIARFFLINNGYGKGRYAERSNQLLQINKVVATYIYRFLYEYGASRISTLDRADRISVLKTMGLHSFTSFGPDGRRIESPFFVPDGERVKRVAYEVMENAEKIVSDIIAQTGAIVDDTIHGFWSNHIENTDHSAKLPIIGFHGFRNISKIAEQFDKRLKLNRENQNRIETDNIYASTGLNDVEAEKQRRAIEYGTAGADDASSVFDL